MTKVKKSKVIRAKQPLPKCRIYITYRSIYFMILHLKTIVLIKIAQCSWSNCYVHVQYLHKLLMDVFNFAPAPYINLQE